MILVRIIQAEAFLKDTQDCVFTLIQTKLPADTLTDKAASNIVC